MRILVVNALPAGNAQAQAAILALRTAGELHVIEASALKIAPCVGCNACWLKTPGVCAIRDDYEQILRAYLQYDATFFLTGTALGFLDHRAKNITDRVLPLATMFTFVKDGQMRHVIRYDKHFRFGLLYFGDADHDYLQLWLKRFAVNFGGESLGAFPIAQAKEAAQCI